MFAHVVGPMPPERMRVLVASHRRGQQEVGALDEAGRHCKFGGMRMQKMPPTVERLVRLMLMLPSDPYGPLWSSVADDCEDPTTVLALHGCVGDTAKMWPEGAPRTMAEMVLTVFGNPSETTLLLLSQAVGT